MEPSEKRIYLKEAIFALVWRLMRDDSFACYII